MGSGSDHSAVIFDVDGLIVDTEELYYETYNETLADCGTSLARSEYTVCVGHPVLDNSRYAVEHYGLGVSPDAFCEIWMDRFEEAISDPARIAVMPGFLELLDHVRGEGHRLGIASSTERPRMLKTLQNGLLVRLTDVQNLGDVFAAILSGSDVTHTKPAPDIYLLAAERLGVSPTRCLALEDSEAGVQSAKAAGMTVIAVPNIFTAHQDHSSADDVLSSLGDVLTGGYL